MLFRSASRRLAAVGHPFTLLNPYSPSGLYSSVSANTNGRPIKLKTRLSEWRFRCPVVCCCAAQWRSRRRRLVVAPTAVHAGARCSRFCRLLPVSHSGADCATHSMPFPTATTTSLFTDECARVASARGTCSRPRRLAFFKERGKSFTRFGATAKVRDQRGDL